MICVGDPRSGKTCFTQQKIHDIITKAKDTEEASPRIAVVTLMPALWHKYLSEDGAAYKELTLTQGVELDQDHMLIAVPFKSYFESGKNFLPFVMSIYSALRGMERESLLVIDDGLHIFEKEAQEGILKRIEDDINAADANVRVWFNCQDVDGALEHLRDEENYKKWNRIIVFPTVLKIEAEKEIRKLKEKKLKVVEDLKNSQEKTKVWYENIKKLADIEERKRFGEDWLQNGYEETLAKTIDLFPGLTGEKMSVKEPSIAYSFNGKEKEGNEFETIRLKIDSDLKNTVHLNQTQKMWDQINNR